MDKQKLLTPSYCLILGANFLLYFGFYLLLPILPFYLLEVFKTEGITTGIILSCYTIAALTVRPFSGYLLDMFARKPLYLFSFIIFTLTFLGYVYATCILLFTILRIIHGFAFGTVTVAGNTLVIDIMPAERRGEGLGYYGLSNNIAMAVGPMTGLFLHDFYKFDTIFFCALISCILGLLMAIMVKVPAKLQVKSEPISLDRFILIKGISAGFDLLLLSVPYGITTSFVAIYGKELGVKNGTGMFFTLMAIGMAVSRIFSGKQVDRGKVTKMISFGIVGATICFSFISSCSLIAIYSQTLAAVVYFAVALCLGLSFGTMFPAFNTLFVNLAPNNKRGTATSTYLTSWDIGIGFGLVIGGFIGQELGYDWAYVIGALCCLIALIYFRVVVGPFYNRNKLR